MRWYHTLSVLLSIAPAAWAGALADGGVTAQEIADVMKSKGFQAEITTDKDGDPLIRSGSGGSKFAVYFYECKGERRCGSIQFAAGFALGGVDPGKVAEWNRRKRFGRAYRDDVKDPWVEMDVDLEHGATTEAVANDLDRWVVVMGQFQKYFVK